MEVGEIAFLRKKLAGPNGHVTRIDMTDEQVCLYWALDRMNSVYLYINQNSFTNPMLGCKMNRQQFREKY